MNRQPLNRQHGISLVELMISVALGMVLILGVINIFLSSKQAYRVQNALAQLQDNARFALDTISHDLRMSGQIGCNSSVTVTNNTGELVDFGPALFGDEHDNLSITLITGDTGNPTASNVKDGTDVIVTHYASPKTYLLTDESTGSVLTVDSSSHGFVEHTPLIVSDCNSSDIFIAGTVTNNVADSDGNATNNSTVNIGTSAFSKTYTSGAEVSQLIYRAYYIAEDTNTLYRRDAIKWGSDTDVRPTPILEGLEDMEFLYGVDINGDGSSIKFVNADSVTTSSEWDKVASVRITIVLSTQENNIATTNQIYWENGIKKTESTNTTAPNTFTNPNGKIFRAFTTTVNIRNQGLDS